MRTSLALASDTLSHAPWLVVRNARARPFLTPHTCCNMCIVTGRHVHVRFHPQLARPTSGVVGGLVLLVANRLKLERAMRDVEVSTQAFAEAIQHLPRAALADAGLIDGDMRRQDRNAAGNR